MLRVRDALILLACGMVFVFLPHVLYAQEECKVTEYVAVLPTGYGYVENSEAVGPTEAAACAAVLSAWDYPDNATHTFEIRDAYLAGSLLCQMRVYATPKSGGAEFLNATTYFTLQSRQVDCPPPEECDAADVGRKFQKTYAYGSPPGDTCLRGCTASRSASIDVCLGGTCYTEYSVSDAQCTTGAGGLPGPGPITEEGEGETCVGEFCTSNTGGKGCGYLNDSYVCLDRTPADGCQALADGSRVCGDAAPTPPVPDNGTPGVPADSDGQIETVKGDTTTTTYNYYNSGTVGGSARDPGPGPNPAAGSGTGEGEGEGEGSVTGGDSCDAAPVCSGDPLQCAAIAQLWQSRCVDDYSDAELEAAFGEGGDGDIGGAIGSVSYDVGSLDATGWLPNECLEDVQIDMGGQLPVVTIPLSSWCGFMGIIGIMVMMSAYIGAIRIIVGGL